MLRLIPAPLHRAGLRLAHRVRKRIWRVTKPRLTGVTIIARNHAGDVLLVRHNYGRRHWTLPGGGVRRGEEPIAAAHREFREELGCTVELLEASGTHKSILYGARLTRHLFTGRIDRTPEPDGREVGEARFFRRDALPRQCSSLVDVFLELSEQR
jgi:8-oxo-dGTP pyrophosphatase MutT (NUDIX family)